MFVVFLFLGVVNGFLILLYLLGGVNLLIYVFFEFMFFVSKCFYYNLY